MMHLTMGHPVLTDNSIFVNIQDRKCDMKTFTKDTEGALFLSEQFSNSLDKNKQRSICVN